MSDSVDGVRSHVTAEGLLSHTVGYNYVKDFDTPGRRNPSRDYSRQYQNTGWYV
jgi:hypothetical protein